MRHLDSFQERIDQYVNTAEHNDHLHADFTERAKGTDFLIRHRKYIETHKLGYGDTAHHYMWYLLLRHILGNPKKPNLLEIGVFKGQVISLWTLIASYLNKEVLVTGVSPFKGNPLPRGKMVRYIKRFFSIKYRKDLEAANFYPEDNYIEIIGNLFNHFNLPMTDVRLIKGLSNDFLVLREIRKKYSLIYVDGDHTFDGALSDIHNYTQMVCINGYLVMDDASFYLPGTAFWKGHETVSRACEVIPSLGFINVLNVGHNRIYKRIN